MNEAPPTLKTCSRCNKQKELIAENWNRKGAGFRTYCKICTRDYNNAYYRANESIQASVKARRNAHRKLIHNTIRAHKDKPCLDCKQKFRRCQMDFDHRPSEKKEFDIFRAKRLTVSIEKLLAELAKCDLVCSNCHRLRTALRNGIVDE